MQSEPNSGVVLVYDGACPLCRTGARHFCIDESADGLLQRLDKRNAQNHPVLDAIDHERLDLDRGMVLHYQGRLYQGPEALHVMARLGAGTSWAARALRLLFRYRWLAYACYPFLRGTRNVLIRLSGAGKLTHAAPRHASKR